MIARHEGVCSTCGKPISIGQSISWSRKGERKTYHAACRASSTIRTETRIPIGAGAVAVIAPIEEKVELPKPAPKLKKIQTQESALRLTSNSNWTDLFVAVLPHVHRVLLIGAPGTGKSTAAMQIAQCRHRITMTETTSEDALLGMWHLRDNKTVWTDGPLTQAMKQGEPVLVDEIDHYSPEAASLLYSLIDDNPHVETPEGSVTAQDGYKMIMTANEGLETLPAAVQDRIEVIIDANTPANGALADVPEPLRNLSKNYYKALPRPAIRMPATVRRVRTFDKLMKAGFVASVAAKLVFGDNREVLSVLASVASA